MALLFCGNDHELCLICFVVWKEIEKKKMAAVVKFRANHGANENEKESSKFKSYRMDLGKNCGIRLRLTRHHTYVNFGKVSVKRIRVERNFFRVKLTLNFESKARRNFSIVDKRQSVPSRHFLIYLRHGLWTWSHFGEWAFIAYTVLLKNPKSKW